MTVARFAAASGRYDFLEIDDIEYRVYFEENGEETAARIPLLLQHTAGADGRQWRHVLEDRELARDFRMIAYDLPYHGKSVPPVGVEWWKHEYRLTKDFLMKFTLTLARALELERPVYMGSSIGGHLALDLALHHPESFRAVIGLEAAAATPGGYLDIWNHPRVGNGFKASLMYGLMSPTSPEVYRRETAWCYSQGAPPVFKGDLYYHDIDHAMGETFAKIDAAKLGVHLLTGEYDWSTPPELSQAVADRIPGATFQTMEGLGHFPMSEDPERFLGYVRPVLEKIRDGAVRGVDA
jgi:pimeloyl-ACP methyl ester carboxylesterase